MREQKINSVNPPLYGLRAVATRNGNWIVGGDISKSSNPALNWYTRPVFIGKNGGYAMETQTKFPVKESNSYIVRVIEPYKSE